MKKGLLMVLTAVFTLALSITAFAGEWKQDAKGWWWDNGDGTYPKNAWQWCDGNGDGISECYYFDGNGYCLMNTTTPDGYLVDANGAWVVDGKVQTQGTVSKAAQVSTVCSLTILTERSTGTSWCTEALTVQLIKDPRKALV